MHISDMLGEYNRNLSAKSENLNGMQGVQKLVSTLKGLTVGNIFEGTVNSIKGGQITLGLSNGQVITARMDGKLNFNIGQSMFFQVKSNDGMQIEIRPYSGVANIQNPTLVMALTSASLPVNEKNLIMVNTMMEEQMSINKESLNEMAKIMFANEGIDSKTVVQMTKAGLPVNKEMAAQFENYKMDRHAITKELHALMEELPKLAETQELPTKQLIELHHVLTGNQKETVLWQSGQVAETELPSEKIQGMPQNASAPEISATTEKQTYPEGTIGNLLSDRQAENLTKQLRQIPELVENETLFRQTGEGEEKTIKLDLNVPVKELLQKVDEALQKVRLDENSNKNMQFEASTAGIDLKKLFMGKEYKTLLKSGLEQDWFVKPDEVKSEHKVQELYERLEHQMEQIEKVVKEMGLTKSTIMNTITDVRNNIEFMNQMNQIYTFVQIPLKMSRQQANADLYVYTNKKRLADPESELTAFLHLELKNLGATDVSVKMHPATKQVKTDFYLKNDEAYDLIERNLPVLEQRLKQKGYQCEISITKEENKVRFMEDFMKKDQRTTGMVHRYSFDVRA